MTTLRENAQVNSGLAFPDIRESSKSDISVEGRYLVPSMVLTRGGSYASVGDEREPRTSSRSPPPMVPLDSEAFARTSADMDLARTSGEMDEDKISVSNKMPRQSILYHRANALLDYRMGRSKHIWSFLSEPDSSPWAYVYARCFTPFILSTVVVPLLQSTKPPMLAPAPAAFLDTIIDVLFLCEFVLRFCVAPRKIRFLANPFTIIDVLSVLPAILRGYVGFVLQPQDVRNEVAIYFLLCVVPVIRMLKALRRFRQFFLLVNAFRNLIEALPVLLFTMFIFVLGFAALLVWLEPTSNIDSLPMAIWLTIVTMTTVGYGDIVPTTSLGFITVSCLLIISMLYTAMPIGIVGYAFTQTWNDRHRILMIQTTVERMAQWGYTARDVAVLFAIFDCNDDRELSFPEFHQMLAEMGIGYRDEESLELFDFIDKDGSGYVNEMEFVRVMFPGEFLNIYSRDDLDREQREAMRQQKNGVRRISPPAQKATSSGYNFNSSSGRKALSEDRWDTD